MTTIVKMRWNNKNHKLVKRFIHSRPNMSLLFLQESACKCRHKLLEILAPVTKQNPLNCISCQNKNEKNWCLLTLSTEILMTLLDTTPISNVSFWFSQHNRRQPVYAQDPSEILGLGEQQLAVLCLKPVFQYVGSKPSFSRTTLRERNAYEQMARHIVTWPDNVGDCNCLKIA